MANPKKKIYSYNLRALEDKVLLAYSNWEKDDTQATRTEIYNTVKEIAYAILDVGNFAKYGIDFEKGSYEYSIYLFERIIRGRFKFIPHDGKRFPVQNYISKNIRYIVLNKREDVVWQDAVQDLEHLIDKSTPQDLLNSIECPRNNQSVVLDRTIYAKRLYNTLRIYYSHEEISSNLPISLDLLYDNTKSIMSIKADTNLKDFCLILVASAKRLVKDENLNYSYNDITKNNLKQVMSSATRSTLFLSTVVNSQFFPKELLLALDIDSLYRLVALCGGHMIKIPSQRELDTLIGSTVAASRIIMDGKQPNIALNDVKNDMGLTFVNINIQKFISKQIECYNVYNDTGTSNPLINLLVMSVKSLDLLFNELQKKAVDLSHESLLNKYIELSSSLSKFTEALTNIKVNKPKDRIDGESSNSKS